MRSALPTLLGLALAWPCWRAAGWLVAEAGLEALDLPLRAVLLAAAFALAQAVQQKLAPGVAH